VPMMSFLSAQLVTLSLESWPLLVGQGQDERFEYVLLLVIVSIFRCRLFMLWRYMFSFLLLFKHSLVVPSLLS